jgi:competence protein ComEC
MSPTAHARGHPPGTGGVRIDPAITIAACLALGAAAAVAPVPALLAGAVGLVALRRALGGRVVAIAVLAVLLGWGRARATLAEHAQTWEAGRALFPAPRRCAAQGVITSSASLLDERMRVDIELEGLDCDGAHDDRRWLTRLYVPRGAASADADLALERGARLAIVADLASTSESTNFLLPDPRPGAARRGVVLSGGALSVALLGRGTGVGAWIDRARAHARGRILATFGGGVSAMARALVLGESDLSPEDERAFQRSGLSHLLAVSGTHLILAVLALVRGLEALLRRWRWLAERVDIRRPAALLGLCLGPVYADFAGGSGSAWRAAWMLCAVLGVRALGRHVFATRILAVSLVSGWVVDALVVFDPSFSLSIAATTGLLVMGRRLDENLLERAADLTQPRAPDLGRFVRALARASLTTLAASVPCVPILLSISPGLSLASVGANLLAAPLGEAVALPLCLAHALAAPVPELERGIALTASGALTLIRAIARVSAAVDWLYFELPPPSAWHLAVLTAAIPLTLAPRARPWLACDPPIQLETTCRGLGALAPLLICLALLVLSELLARWQSSASHARGHLRVTALDVGQGDATFVDLPDGRLMLIDGGGNVGSAVDPGERVILPTLRARRRERIDILVLTHPHPDHFGGLLAVANAIEIGEFWSTLEAAEQPTAASLRGLLEVLGRKGVRRRSARELCQMSGNGTATIAVLHPCPAVAEHGANDNSLVLRLQLGQHAALLVGDAERWAERRLLAAHPDELRADFLKVGHHGSRTSSTPEFITRVSPSFASISSGVRNRFGHPHPHTLETLARAGAGILRVDQGGAVEWQTDGRLQRARVARSEHP